MTDSIDKYKCVVCGSVWSKNQLLGTEQYKQCGDACCGGNVYKVPENQELVHKQNE
jgi:hypothetical protein